MHVISTEAAQRRSGEIPVLQKLITSKRVSIDPGNPRALA